MEKIVLQRPAIQLVGIKVRTKPQDELDPATAKISPTVQQYFHAGISSKILHRKNPGVTLCVYTEYESDHTGPYTYFIGEEVTSFDDLFEGLTTHTIPAQSYTKFTTASGAMPQVLISAWMDIWKMTSSDFGGERTYHSDFEVHDQRAADRSNTVLDLYVGIEPTA